MHSIRIRITAVTLAAIIISVLIVSWIGFKTVSEDSDIASVEKLNLMSRDVKKTLDAYLNSIKQSVDMTARIAAHLLDDMPESLAAALKEDTISAEQIRELDDYLRAHSANVMDIFESIADTTNGVVTYYYCIDSKPGFSEHGFFYSKNGNEVFEEQEPIISAQLDPEDIEHNIWYYAPIQEGNPVWVGPYKNFPPDDRWLIGYTAPIYKDDTLIGVLGMDLPLETMIGQVRKIRVYETGFPFLLDSENHVLYHPGMDIGSNPEAAGQIMQMDISAEPDSGNQMIRYYAQGIERQLSFSSLINEMRVVVSVPVDEITVSRRNFTQAMITAGSVIILVFTVLIMWIMRAITRPLRQLTAASRKLAGGDYDVKLDYKGKDEIGVLTESFIYMRDRLKIYISNLNSRAYTDALTNVKNKGAFDNYMVRLNDMIRSGEDENMPEFAIIMFDCNHLKEINDEYGHLQGDKYLQTASKLICDVYVHSPVARLGGDEFAVILERHDYDNREKLLEDFDRMAEEINAKASEPWEKVSLAKGMAVFDPNTDQNAEQVLRRADEQMYLDKKKSR